MTVHEWSIVALITAAIALIIFAVYSISRRPAKPSVYAQQQALRREVSARVNAELDAMAKQSGYSEPGLEAEASAKFKDADPTKVADTASTEDGDEDVEKSSSARTAVQIAANETLLTQLMEPHI